MAMKLMILAFALMLAVATRVSSIPLPPEMAHSPVPTAHPPVPTALPPVPITKKISKYCAQGCTTYCGAKPGIRSKRSCQKVCSWCCDKCNCIPKIGEPKCGVWETVMRRGVQVVCP